MVAGKRLGELLVDEQLVSAEDVERALGEQRRGGKPIGQTLVDMGVLDERALAALLARQLGLEFVDLNEVDVDLAAAALIPPALARRHAVLPLGVEGPALVLAMHDPTDVVALDDVRMMTDRPLRRVVAARKDILAAFERLHGAAEPVEDLATVIHVDEEPEGIPDLGGIGLDDTPVVRFVNGLLARALRERASDVHIQAQEDQVRVRYRIDGVLHDVTSQSRKVHPAVVSRIKVMADMDIAERRLPQDGRMSMTVGRLPVDVRVSTLPTVLGETVVLRLLDTTSGLLRTSELGFLDDTYARYEQAFRRPYGMILVTGPTGSGKSTTLYATLNAINDPAVNVITVEDPVEYRLAGISQVQIHPKSGLTFPIALRAILRQDPDVVLVGEMRDPETAKIGMEAAMTGHLVLSTLHTNDAPSAVTRLAEMGVDPFLVGAAVDCVVGQRLARRLCERCKRPYEPTWAELQSAGILASPDDPLPSLYDAVGCPACARTGYRGRVALHEVMLVSEEIERLIAERAATDDIAKFAKAQGMRTMREDGLKKVLLGWTTLDEVARVVT